MQELLGEQHAPRLGDRDRRGAEVLPEQPAQLSAADAQPLGQRFDAGFVLVQGSLGDQGQCAADGIGRATPEGELGGDFGAAAQARSEAGLLRRGGRGKEAAILELRHARRADRPAVDAGRRHAHEDPAVETDVMGLESAVESASVVQFHGWSFPRARGWRSRFSDVMPGSAGAETWARAARLCFLRGD